MPDATVREPSQADLESYRQGRLTPVDFDRVDRWLLTQDPATQERLLTAETAGPTFLAAAGALMDSAPPLAFAPERVTPDRFRPVSTIGTGGMGIVDLVHDHRLGRDLAVKRCRPRRPEESMAAWSRRLRLFKREARITALLEHPGIVPVHDVGEGPHHAPAFAMKRLDGEALTKLIARRRHGAPLDAVALVEVVLRVADAVGYAHQRSIVHRDLKPDNIVVGSAGAVHVIDWGLAGFVTDADELPAEPGDVAVGDPTLSGAGMGTPAWMAPEQHGHRRADPRMDVFALGGLLMAGLTGRGPRDGLPPGSTAVDLTPLADRRLPRGLKAVARRCLSMDPSARYADAAVVADDLRRWLALGISSAERYDPLARLFGAVRQSPRVVAGVMVLLLVALVAVVADAARQRASHATAMDTIARLQAVDPSDRASLSQARQEVGRVLEAVPRLPAAADLLARVDASIRTLDRVAQQNQMRTAAQDLAQGWLRRGPWPGEAAAWRLLLQRAGVTLLRSHLVADTAALRAHPLRDDLLPGLVHLVRAQALGSAGAADITGLAELLSAVAPSPAWQALGRMLQAPVVDGNELVAGWQPEPELFDDEAQIADLALATFRIQGTLAQLGVRRLAADPGAFWPRVVAARRALERNEYRVVTRHCLVALGKEPTAIWLRLLFADVALWEGDHARVLAEAMQGLSVNPDHAELIALRVAALAGLGYEDEARAKLTEAGIAPLLRWHLDPPSGQPIERPARDLAERGIDLGTEAVFRPLVLPE